MTDAQNQQATQPPAGELCAEAGKQAAAPPPIQQPKLEARRAGGEDRLAKYYEPCPQGQDCAGDGKHRRLFDCEQGCGFRGCAACMEIHEAEPHTGDSETMLEMYRNAGGRKG